MEISHQYDDIINLPHHVSTKHPHMSMLDRAAQFSPFAALTGYEAAVDETARLTDRKLELSEDQIASINEMLSSLKPKETINVEYFAADARKEGGAYVIVVGAVKKVDSFSGILLLNDGQAIPFDDIISIER